MSLSYNIPFLSIMLTLVSGILVPLIRREGGALRLIRGVQLGVAGLSALGHPIGEACHRPHLACALLGVGEETIVTPSLLARLLTHEAGQLKGVGDPKKFRVLLNQADGPEELALARETARDIQTWLPGTRVVAAALRETDCVKEVFSC